MSRARAMRKTRRAVATCRRRWRWVCAARTREGVSGGRGTRVIGSSKGGMRESSGGRFVGKSRADGRLDLPNSCAAGMGDEKKISGMLKYVPTRGKGDRGLL